MTIFLHVATTLILFVTAALATSYLPAFWFAAGVSFACSAIALVREINGSGESHEG